MTNSIVGTDARSSNTKPSIPHEINVRGGQSDSSERLEDDASCGIVYPPDRLIGGPARLGARRRDHQSVALISLIGQSPQTGSAGAVVPLLSEGRAVRYSVGLRPPSVVVEIETG